MSNTKVFINEGLEVLTSILENVKAEKIFLVTGKKSYQSVKKKIELQLKNKDVFIFNDFDKNPQINDLRKGVIAYNKYAPDLVIAIGGGTAIDVAKSIKILAVQKDDLEDIITGNKSINFKSLVPLVVMPTTAGTGSEATHFSVVYIGNKKYSLANVSMLPDYAVLDPRLVISMPKYVAACTAFDALTQAVESYWSRNATINSKRHAAEAINLILPNIVESINEPSLINKKKMINAAYLSGCSINITKTTAPHALSYSLTSIFNVAHGHAVASLLAPTALITYELSDSEQKQTMIDIFKLFGCNDILEFQAKWLLLMKLCDLDSKLTKYHIETKVVVSGVNIERMKNHPVELSLENIECIVEAVV
jgi:alcohol dehydrogenase